MTEVATCSATVRGNRLTRCFVNGLLCVLLVAIGFSASACESHSAGDSGLRPINNTDCLPNVTLVDKSDKQIDLASLKGKPLLVDFFYTSCPGPCLMMTAKMARIADRLGPRLGSQVTLLSITIDPEHDQPKQLASYAKTQDADRPGWVFLTGTQDQIDQVLTLFNVDTAREADGTIGHVLAFFLVGPDGRQWNQYPVSDSKTQDIVSDLDKVAMQR